MTSPALRLLLSCLAAAPMTIGVATAQCPFSSLSMSSIGRGCTTVFGTPPTMSGFLDVNSCSLDLTLTAFSGCCNTFLQGRVIALGLQQNNLPLPMIGAGCTLWVQPDAVLFLPTTAGDTVTVPLPPGLQPPFTLYAQGAALYFTTIGLSYDAQLSDGQAATLQ